MRKSPTFPKIGRLYGLLKIIQFGPLKTSKDKTLWKCKCKCGKIVWRPGDSLKLNIKSSCGCLKKGRILDKHQSWKGFKGVPGRYFSRVLHYAKQSGRKVFVTIEDLGNLFEKQKERCAISGVKIYFNKNFYKDKKGDTASLDRKDNSGQYSIDNIQWVHKDINMMKKTYPQEYFIKICKKIAKFNE